MLRFNEKANLIAKLMIIAIAVGITAAIKYFGSEFFGEGPPLIFFIPVVLLAGYIGGFWTGVIATCLSGLVAVYYFMYPAFNFVIESKNDQVRLGIFIFIGISVSFLFEYLHKQAYKLLQLNKTKSRFIATLGHELRAPLNRIELLTADLLASDEFPESCLSALDEIRSNIEIQSVLINDVLDGTRAEQHKIECHKGETDIVNITNQAILIVESERLRKQIIIQKKYQEPTIAVIADKIRIKQVVWNLLRNAIKFSPDGSTIEINICRSSSLDVLVEIRDSGVGVEKMDLSYIFEPYRQAKRISGLHHETGLGLGLAICKEIVSEHGGTIWAESDGIGCGASFKFKLSASADKQKNTDIKADTDTDMDTESDSESVAKTCEDPNQDLTPIKNTKAPLADQAKIIAKTRILLIDDDLATLTLMKKYLEGFGVQTLTAASFEQAKAIDPELFDIVVSDFNLGDANGWDVLNYFKSLNPQLKVICVSGDEMAPPANSNAIDRFTFDQYLVKPVNRQDIINALS